MVFCALLMAERSPAKSPQIVQVKSGYMLSIYQLFNQQGEGGMERKEKFNPDQDSEWSASSQRISFEG